MAVWTFFKRQSSGPTRMGTLSRRIYDDVKYIFYSENEIRNYYAMHTSEVDFAVNNGPYADGLEQYFVPQKETKINILSL